MGFFQERSIENLTSDFICKCHLHISSSFKRSLQRSHIQFKASKYDDILKGKIEAWR